MINRVVLVGRLTKDPELRYTPSGIASCRFTVAVNRPFTSQSGEKEADFINCVAWRKQAENLANYQRKGNLIGLEGRIQTGSYEGQDGKRVYTTDVVADTIQFLEPRSGGAGANAGAPMQPQYGGGGYGGGQQGFSNNPPQQNFGGNQGNQNQDPFGGYSNQPQPPQNQQNYTRMDEDPFASNKGPIEVTEDDLPF